MRQRGRLHRYARDRTEHGDGRGDDPVAEEQGRSENPERDQHGAVLVTLGIFGAALFFGDGIITPAISVLGAVAGVSVESTALTHLVVPLSVAILICLFVLQRYGSGTIGWLFGPVMLLWFTVIAAFGLSQVVQDPGVFQALSPTWAIRFMIDHGFAGYLVLGGVVLAVTGAEALYADRGHL